MRYSPCSLEEVFSDTGLPALRLLGNSENQGYKKGLGLSVPGPWPLVFAYGIILRELCTALPHTHRACILQNRGRSKNTSREHSRPNR